MSRFMTAGGFGRPRPIGTCPSAQGPRSTLSTYRHFLLAAALLGLVHGFSAEGYAETPAVRQLLQRADYLREKGRMDRARVIYERVLVAVPSHPRALVALATAAARAGEEAEARELLARYLKSHPRHPDRASLEHAVRLGARYHPLIQSARARAQAGQPDEAVVFYRQAFGPGGPPPDLALEYYQTLGGTKGGWAESRRGLEALVRQHATPDRRMAFARHLTYREPTRRDGVTQLFELSKDPATREEALDALRDGLLWLNARETDMGLFRAFLAERNDPEVQQRLSALRPSARRVRDRTVAKGFERLKAEDIDGAKALFQSNRSSSAESVVGLAAIALREERFEEAETLFAQAREAAPERPEMWKEGLTTARFWRAMRAGQAALDEGRLAEAEAALTEAAAEELADRHHALSGLGFVDVARGDVSAARVHFKEVLELDPRSESALRGLRDIAVKEEDFEAAVTFNQQLIDFEAPSAQPAGALEAERNRRLAERERAAARPAVALRRLETARAADPDNPWVLHDLIDLHLAEGQMARARVRLKELLILAPELPEARVLHARLESEAGRPQRALDILAGLPNDKLTKDLARFVSQTAVQVEVQRAVRQWFTGARAQARQALLRLRTEHSLEPHHLGAIAEGWSEVGAYQRAISTLQEALSLQEVPSSGLQLQLVSVFLRAEMDAEVADLLRRLEGTPMPSTREREDLLDLKVAFAVRIADQAREEERFARAFDVLAPLLAEHPNNTSLLSALGRLFESSGRLQEAREVFDRILRDKPRDIDARSGAVQTALALGRVGEARELARQGLRLEPQHPKMALVQARLHAQLGEDAEAMTAYHRARRLAEQRAMGTSSKTVPSNDGRSLGLLREAQYPAYLQAGYAAFGLAEAVEAPRSDTQLLLEMVDREERQIRAKYAVEVEGDFGIRQREGEAGLGLVTELGGRALARIPVGYSTRLWIEASPLVVDPGARQLDVAAASRFGSLGAVNGATFETEDTSVFGASLRAGVEWKGLSGFVGSTPLGFPRETFVAGVGYRAQLGRFGFRIEGSRSAVTDSVLSFAGMRDPGTDEVWGGVVRQGGRADLSFETGAGLYYLFGGGYHLEGTNVAQNAQWLGGGGAEWGLYEKGSDRVTVGLATVGLGFERDLSYFTLGHGGYFSPQLFFRAGVPFAWKAKRGSFKWRMFADPGLNWFRTDTIDWFPTDEALQSARVAVAGSAEPFVYEGRTVLSFSFDGGGELSYAATTELSIGARIDVHFAEDYQEILGGFFVTYAFVSQDRTPSRRKGTAPRQTMMVGY